MLQKQVIIYIIIGMALCGGLSFLCNKLYERGKTEGMRDMFGICHDVGGLYFNEETQQAIYCQPVL